MKKKTFIFMLIFLLPAIAWAQEKMSIQGVVYDDLNTTIPGASVIEKGTTNGTVTDIDGKFTIQVTRGATLEISYIGYKTQEVRVTNTQPLKITLKEDAQTLDEVVITGYSGKQLRSKSTNSIAKVANEKRPVLTPTRHRPCREPFPDYVSSRHQEVRPLLRQSFSVVVPISMVQVHR